MKRRFAIILLLLIAGAMVNVAVAWGCALCSPPLSNAPLLRNRMPTTALWWGEDQVHQAAWIKQHLPTGQHPARGYTVSGPGVDIERIGGMGLYFSVPANDFFAERIVSGLPARSFWGLRWESEEWSSVSNPPRITSGRVGFLLLDGFAQPRAVSYAAVWPGIIINTLLYALLLWLLFFAPFAARRMLRRRRGQCEKCAYPVGTWGTPVCTECGAAVRPLVARSS